MVGNDSKGVEGGGATPPALEQKDVCHNLIKENIDPEVKRGWWREEIRTTQVLIQNSLICSSMNAMSMLTQTV